MEFCFREAGVNAWCRKIEAALKELVFGAYLNIGMTRTLILCSLTFYMDVIMRFMKTENMEMCQCLSSITELTGKTAQASIKNDKK